MEVNMPTADKNALIQQQQALFKKNLLENSLNYKLKKHQSNCMRLKEEPTRTVSTTSTSLHLLDDNLATVQHWPEMQNKDSIESNSKDLSTCHPSSAVFGQTETSVVLPSQRNEDAMLCQDNATFKSYNHAIATHRSKSNFEDLNIDNFVDSVDRVKVRKRNGVFEPFNKNHTRKQKVSYPLCRRQPSGRHYKTFILTGETITEIQVKSDGRKSSDKSKRVDKLIDETVHQEKNDFVDMDDELAFRRPEYIPSKRDINSVGLTWRFPAIDQETTKRELKKPVWSWLVTQDNYCNKICEKKNLQNQVLDLKGRHSKDIHPVATAMNRQGISTTRVKWAVPPCRASTVDVSRLIMGRLELIKRPMTCLIND
ncbi:uncharacterized protein LOC106056851 [Biomphalaria glabrata]|uniref:Uncharacterized protein LOC106056851 n=1 Tax=Biomphalaria glabrata TaxID=6526 RepID=A0A9U8E1J8_BIOGL|nr:uncharacterized protein LOC106056851 [Biomphalaria glabrata]XP_013069191.2 uncharacterized protein LOC106056851 [Biomphalaria glabrata]XP_013069193.2 uncharacterized protein LOC106056851 [Biomphalaria glabrata]XP_055879987.1 uncharacterized protein LOC106056851 [Biomphalaria glabrata]